MTPIPVAIAEELKKAHALIQASSNIMLATHENPDPDGLGGMLAFAEYLRSIGKSFTAHVIGTPPNFLSFLPGFELLTPEFPSAQPDLLIAFDYGNFERMRLSELNLTKTKIITIDHHPKATQHGDVNIVDVSFSSSCELGYHFFAANNLTVTKDIATCLYTGIVTDTGGFSHSNTSSRTFEVAAKLLACGINAELISKRMLGFKSYHAAILAGIALERLAFDKQAEIAYSYVSWKDLERLDASWEDADTIIHLMNAMNAQNIKCLILFKEINEGMVSLSFRSDSERLFDTQKLAKLFGGGGHIFASGAKIQGPLKDVIASVIERARQEDFSVSPLK